MSNGTRQVILICVDLFQSNWNIGNSVDTVSASTFSRTELLAFRTEPYYWQTKFRTQYNPVPVQSSTSTIQYQYNPVPVQSNTQYFQYRVLVLEWVLVLNTALIYIRKWRIEVNPKTKYIFWFGLTLSSLNWINKMLAK